MRTPSPLGRLHHPRTIRCDDETSAITAPAVATSPARAEDSSALALRPNSGTTPAIGPLHGYFRVLTKQMLWNVSRLEFLGKFTILELEHSPMKVANGSAAQIVGPKEVYGKCEADGPITYTLMPKDGFLEHAPGRLHDECLLARIADTRFPGDNASGLSSRSFTELSPEFNAYHILNLLVYLASNDLVPDYEDAGYLPGWPELLDLLVYRVSRRIVMAILSSDYLSIRATWENTLENANELQHRDAIVLLVEIALQRHSDWIYPIMNTDVLFAAVIARSSSLVQALLQRGARPNRLRHRGEIGILETPIVAAIRTEAWDCANLLLEDIDINEELWLSGESQEQISHLHLLFEYVEGMISRSWMVNPDDGLYFFSHEKRTETIGLCTRALGLFLQAGADVDAPCVVHWSTRDTALETLHRELATPPEWLPTYLDISFYWDEQLFSYLSVHSRKYSSPTKATRAGIIKALLDGGNEALDLYFRVKPRPAQSVLEMLLVEQFFMQLKKSRIEYEKVNAHLARLFIEYGVAMNPNTAAVLASSYDDLWQAQAGWAIVKT